jgi:hypothetical protein
LRLLGPRGGHGYDDASASVYATDWIHGQNGGFGFLPWIISPNPDLPTLAPSSLRLSRMKWAGNIDTAGRSWGCSQTFRRASLRMPSGHLRGGGSRVTVR